MKKSKILNIIIISVLIIAIGVQSYLIFDKVTKKTDEDNQTTSESISYSYDLSLQKVSLKPDTYKPVVEASYSEGKYYINNKKHFVMKENNKEYEIKNIDNIKSFIMYGDNFIYLIDEDGYVYSTLNVKDGQLLITAIKFSLTSYKVLNSKDGEPISFDTVEVIKDKYGNTRLLGSKNNKYYTISFDENKFYMDIINANSYEEVIAYINDDEYIGGEPFKYVVKNLMYSYINQPFYISIYNDGTLKIYSKKADKFLSNKFLVNENEEIKVSRMFYIAYNRTIYFISNDNKLYKYVYSNDFTPVYDVVLTSINEGKALKSISYNSQCYLKCTIKDLKLTFENGLEYIFDEIDESYNIEKGV